MSRATSLVQCDDLLAAAKSAWKPIGAVSPMIKFKAVAKA